MLYDGISVNQLGVVFNMRANDVAKKLGGLQSVGIGRQGNPLYTIAEAAPRLVKVPVTDAMIARYVQTINPKSLPPLLSQLFWQAMASRRKYEELAGDLWLTSDVIKVASETFQSLRMSLLLIPDALMNETELTERQMRIVQEVIDTALDDMREKLVERLAKPSGGASVEAEEPL